MEDGRINRESARMKTGLIGLIELCGMLYNVYKALNKLPFISDDTRKKIVELLARDLKESGYGKPNRDKSE
jgi:hypothetical protein